MGGSQLAKNSDHGEADARQEKVPPVDAAHPGSGRGGVEAGDVRV